MPGIFRRHDHGQKASTFHALFPQAAASPTLRFFRNGGDSGPTLAMPFSRHRYPCITSLLAVSWDTPGACFRGHGDARPALAFPIGDPAPIGYVNSTNATMHDTGTTAQMNSPTALTARQRFIM